MDPNNNRILVIGAGVNGSVCAAGLYKAGIDVTVLARGKRYEELREQGIIIENPFKNTHSVTQVPVINSLEPDDIYEYILVIVRKNQVADLLPVLARNRSPNVVFMLNNPSGPDEFVQALGKERVMLGFVFAGGRRFGNIVRAIGEAGNPIGTNPLGELDGSVTPRLTRLVGIFCKAGFKAKTSTQMTDYLATHASMVAPFAHQLIKHGCDNHSLAHSGADLSLLIDAMREVPDVLEANGYKIVPAGNANSIKFIPKFILIPLLRLLLATRTAEVGGAWHCQQAPDEMHQLGVELMALVDKSGLPVPTLRKLFASNS
ncbi:MAG TPA: 2-dehydropantoate 2-reductase N-terminal domain-containing protein [Longilinea sp.]|nr:2-dehydropantoate 2-reductase N-terminal domain-containing protein [Longilinea sp.]